MNKYEVKNITCSGCGESYSIKMESTKFNIWIREDIPLKHLFPKMSFNIQLMLVKGVCVDCYYDIGEEFTGSLGNE